MAGHVYALLVGIDAYTGVVPQLSGCVNDVTAFTAVLQGRVAAEDLSLVTVTDEDATRAAVTTEFTRLLGQAGPEDVALFYYSGHGAHQDAPEELWPFEPDHQNETLVLVDSREPGGWDLADKELAVLIAQVAASGCHLLVVLDCCHSGDATRDVDEVVRQAPPDSRHRPIESFLTGTVEQAAAQAAAAADGSTTRDLDQAPRERWTPPAGRHVLLAACRSSEKAKEIRTQGQHRGAMSAALEKTLLQSEDTPSYRDLLLMVTSQVTTTVRDQHPQFETVDSSELDRPFLGGSIPDTPRPLTLSHRPEGWVIDSGAVHGVPEPITIGETTDTTELAIYALSAAGRGQPLATAIVTRVLPDRSVVTVTPELDPSSIYRAVMTSIPLKPLAVAVAGDAAGTTALRSAADNADSTLIDLIEASATAPPPDLQVEATAAGFVITRPGLVRPLVPVVAGEGREGRTIAALEHVARWLRLSGLTNPTSRLATNAMHVSVVTADGSTDDEGTVEIAYVDDKPPKFTVTLENTTKEPLWAALLDLTDSYGIYTDAFAAGRVALAPGEKTSLELGGEVPDVLWKEGVVTVTDRLIVVTSTMEFDPRSLQQGDLAVSTVPGSDGGDGTGGMTTRSAYTPRSTLERMLGSVTTRRLPPRSTEAVADWRTNRIDVVTSRPRP
ncbi:caspase domain-containing protein [Humibacillus xanthopallidus]|uniref:Caspase domain-containing protein n=1 Tax=Humibacillus xanthopallidus TaxID=412689 RepID=A0A543PWD3_9MICO|nr:caspase family protein [Humibacillus xanthopallidus]TQN48389.1 caspase domain-containing protein [Humibacillus xanthopallidus]